MDDENETQYTLEFQSVSAQPFVEGPWMPSQATLRQGEGRVVLLFGASGAGKTQAAIQAFQDKRILVVQGSIFGLWVKGRDVAEAVNLLQADVLIIDDLGTTVLLNLLEEIEVLARRKVTVIITVMTRGALPHLAGLRPGRVDEMFRFQPPDTDGRLRLLQSFAPGHEWAEAVQDQRAQGLTPAYLREWASRVQRGIPWQNALASLSLQRQIVEGYSNEEGGEE